MSFSEKHYVQKYIFVRFSRLHIYLSMADWLIDYIVFYAVSAIYRPYNGGSMADVLVWQMF